MSTRADRRLMSEVMLDLHDYEGRLLEQMDRGGILMPPPPLPGGPDYDSISSKAMERIRRNRRVADEIYRRIKTRAAAQQEEE